MMNVFGDFDCSYWQIINDSLSMQKTMSIPISTCFSESESIDSSSKNSNSSKCINNNKDIQFDYYDEERSCLN